MKLPPARIPSLGALALALITVMSTGVASATSEPPGSGPTGDPKAPGCAEVTVLLDAQDRMVDALIAEDVAALGAIIEQLPDLVTAARAAAPADIAGAVEAWSAPGLELVALLEGVDLTDQEAVGAALSSLPQGNEASVAAEDEVRTWAAETCAWESGFVDPFADAPEPPECEILDAATAADAAGVDLDVTDADGGADVSLPGFWTKSCSYGNGAMSLSTISYNTLDQATAFYTDNIGDGEFLDVELGTLPASTLVTTVDGRVLVSVLEAAVPFSVGFSEDSATPEAAVAAAEALLASLPEEVPPTMSSEAP